MQKNRKIRQLLASNHIERDNFTLVVRLKQTVEGLKERISEQDEVIGRLRRDAKNSKM